MSTFSRAEAEGALAPFHERIRDVIDRAFNDLVELRSALSANGVGPFLYERTTANVLFDFVIQQAHAEFGDDQEVRVIDETQTVKFCIGEKVLLRFKKGDKNNLGRNLRTQAVIDFVSPEAELPGIPPAATKVEVLYAMNDLESEIETVIVAARNGDQMLWHYEIDTIGDGNIVELPITTTTSDEEEDEEILVRPRVRSQDSDSDSKGD